MQKSRLVVLIAGLAIAVLVRAQEPDIEAAQQLFARYVALEQTYDASVADLYADDAFIKTRRKPPMGEARDVTIPAPEYKTLLRRHMLAAEAQGQRSTYSNVTYTPEGEFVRIDAAWSAEPRKRASPISFLVGRSATGTWLIYEESSQAPPWER